MSDEHKVVLHTSCFDIEEFEYEEKHDYKVTFHNNSPKTYKNCTKTECRTQVQKLGLSDDIKEIKKVQEQIPLNSLLTAMDKKDRNFYDNLDPEMKKKFSAFMGLKWMAMANGDADLEHYYIASTNHHANMHMFNLGKDSNSMNHTKLQWLMLTAASPGVGSVRHNWIKQKPNNLATGIKKEIAEIYPTMKEEDIEVICKLKTEKELKAEIKAYKKAMGE